MSDHPYHLGDGATTPEVSSGPEVTVYWRPGCLFCSSLLRGLDRAGIAADRVDIWRDPDGAAFVRAVTGGDETVPTVLVGELALVNPTLGEVRRALGRDRPRELSGRRRWGRFPAVLRRRG